MQAQAYGWPVAPAWGVGEVVSGTDLTDQPLTSSVTALGGTQKAEGWQWLHDLFLFSFFLRGRPKTEGTGAVFNGKKRINGCVQTVYMCVMFFWYHSFQGILQKSRVMIVI